MEDDAMNQLSTIKEKLEAGKGKEIDPSLEPPEGSLVKPILDF